VGNPPFPHTQIRHPYTDTESESLVWKTEDWDPALRFWTLPYDPNLTEWLRSVDPSLPSILAAREFGSQPRKWQFLERSAAAPEDKGAWRWLEAADLAWEWKAADWQNRNNAIANEIRQLQMLMQDDRGRYLAEAEAQADGLADYIIHFMAIDRYRYPWTVELISCGLAIGNIFYFYAKSVFRRVRPSFLCPGLVPPLGPPGHPAFPSGHSLLGHLIALLLLEIKGVHERFGIYKVEGGPGEKPVPTTLDGTAPVASPLLWLAQRLAKNREVLGLHYPSDSSASRHLAAGIWNALFDTALDPKLRIQCPTLQLVLNRARAEWI